MRIKQSNTCIAAIKLRNGRIAMAADRRVSWGFSQAQAMPRPKIQKRDGIILAGTGDGYLCGLIVDLLKIPTFSYENYDLRTLDTYMHNQFFDSVCKLLKSKNFKDQHNVLRVPGDCSAEIIIAIHNHLYN